MYAIIAAGGRQYRVSQGDVIYIDKVNQEADSKISFDVLMIGGEGDVTKSTRKLIPRFPSMC